MFYPCSLLLLLFFTFSFTSYAQNQNYTISGKVIDDELGVPLEYATVSITSPDDPDFIDGGVTDIDGEFALSVPAGTYNIAIEYISYETKNFNNRQIDSDLNLGSIELGISSDSLDEVVVVAETTEVEESVGNKIDNI